MISGYEVLIQYQKNWVVDSLFRIVILLPLPVMEKLSSCHIKYAMRVVRQHTIVFYMITELKLRVFRSEQEKVVTDTHLRQLVGIRIQQV